MTKRSKEGAAALRKFQRDHCHNAACWYCNKHFPKLDVHHIVKRRGMIFDDLRNFFAACRLCHSRMEGARLVFPTYTLEPIPLQKVLEIKQQRDGLDLAFLRVLAGPGDGRSNMTFGEGME